MKKFVQNIILFLSIILSIIFIGLLLPATPRERRSLLFAEVKKDSLLINVPSPRIIFIGGSNLSFGLNSEMIKDSLGLNPINTGINASIGLIYMIDNALEYIHSGDIVVVAPEYQQFYDNTAYGSEELLRTIFDVSPSKIIKLRYKQWNNIYSLMPKFSLSKFNPNEYFGYFESDIYGVSSFNKYGDVFTHWKLQSEKIISIGSLGENYNPSIICELANFKQKLQEKGALLYVSYPCFQATSFDLCSLQIMRIEQDLKKNGFILLGTAERYKIPDEIMFNTMYHLLKKGVDYRTNLLIQDIKSLKQ